MSLNMENAKRTELETAMKGRTTYRLMHSTAGLEAAGAGSRQTAEKWGVLFYDHGAENGRWFREEHKARELFAQWVKT